MTAAVVLQKRNDVFILQGLSSQTVWQKQFKSKDIKKRSTCKIAVNIVGVHSVLVCRTSTTIVCPFGNCRLSYIQDCSIVALLLKFPRNQSNKSWTETISFTF